MGLVGVGGAVEDLVAEAEAEPALMTKAMTATLRTEVIRLRRKTTWRRKLSR